MNIYRADDTRFDFNKHLNRVNLTKGNEWISLSLTSFDIFLNLIQNDSIVEKVIIRQNGGDIEVLSLMKNYLVTLVCKNFTTYVTFPEIDGNKIRDNIPMIKENLHKLKTTPTGSCETYTASGSKKRRAKPYEGSSKRSRKNTKLEAKQLQTGG